MGRITVRGAVRTFQQLYVARTWRRRRPLIAKLDRALDAFTLRQCRAYWHATGAWVERRGYPT